MKPNPKTKELLDLARTVANSEYKEAHASAILHVVNMGTDVLPYVAKDFVDEPLPILDALAILADASTVPQFGALLSSPIDRSVDFEQRQRIKSRRPAALRALKAMGSEAAMRAYYPGVWNTEDTGYRLQDLVPEFAEGVKAFGPPFAQLLAQECARQGVDADRRRVMVTALAACKAEVVRPVVLAMLAKGDHADLATAAKGAAALGGPEEAAAVEAALEKQLSVKPTSRHERRDSEFPPAIAVLYRDMAGTEAVPLLVRLAATPTSGVAAVAQGAILDLGSEALGPLTARISNENAEVATMAAELAMRIRKGEKPDLAAHREALVADVSRRRSY